MRFLNLVVFVACWLLLCGCHFKDGATVHESQVEPRLQTIFRSAFPDEPVDRIEVRASPTNIAGYVFYVGGTPPIGKVYVNRRYEVFLQKEDAERLVFDSYTNAAAAALIKKLHARTDGSLQILSGYFALRSAELHSQPSLQSFLIPRAKSGAEIYEQLARSNRQAIEAFYALCSAGSSRNIDQWLEFWRRADPDNSLPFYLHAALLATNSPRQALRQIEMGNRGRSVVHRPLFARFAHRLTPAALTAARAEWTTGLSHPGSRLVAFQQDLVDHLDSQTFIQLLVMNNKIAAGKPANEVDLARGASAGVRLLRQSATVSFLDPERRAAEIEFRTRILLSLRDAESSASQIEALAEQFTTNTLKLLMQ